MKYRDLRDFIRELEKRGELKRIQTPVSPVLEMTEIADRVLRAGGPALLFERPRGYDIPVLANLFGTPKRVALGMGEESVTALREVGKLLAYLKEPEPPKGLKDAWDKLPVLKQVLNMAPKGVSSAPRTTLPPSATTAPSAASMTATCADEAIATGHLAAIRLTAWTAPSIRGAPCR